MGSPCCSEFRVTSSILMGHNLKQILKDFSRLLKRRKKKVVRRTITTKAQSKKNPADIRRPKKVRKTKVNKKYDNKTINENISISMGKSELENKRKYGIIFTKQVKIKNSNDDSASIVILQNDFRDMLWKQIPAYNYQHKAHVIQEEFDSIKIRQNKILLRNLVKVQNTLR